MGSSKMASSGQGHAKQAPWIPTTDPFESEIFVSYPRGKTDSKKTGKGRRLHGIQNIHISPGLIEVRFATGDGVMSMHGTLNMAASIHMETEVGQALKVLVEHLEAHIRRFEKLG